MRSLKHSFPAGKLPVRGQFRVTCMAIASAATANVRRIQRYQMAKIKVAQAFENAEAQPNRLPEALAASFFVSVRTFLARWLGAGLVFSPSLGC